MPETFREGALKRSGIIRRHVLPFGAELSEGETRFRIFGPAVTSMMLKLEGREQAFAMQSEGDGWWSLTRDDAPAGSRYTYVLPDGLNVPDPVSRFQPKDVSGPSEVIDPTSYLWQDRNWTGRPWSEAVLYELHVGAFTEEGTFRAAIGKLNHLAQLGITAIELMCLADFAGRRNWGYDGVLWYSPDSAYGRPDDLKAFIDAAHGYGVMVLLDVVYNHFGPEGNYLPRYFPEFCIESEHTPWGQALNFEGKHSEVVRDLIVQNALYWVEEFHVDGLRLDAAHAMIDKGRRHILDELAERVRDSTGKRHIHLILENDLYVPERLTRDEYGNAKSYTAQWNHDMTHLLGISMAEHCPETPSSDNGETDRLGKALARGYVIAAEMEGKRKPQDRVAPPAFVSFLQTHDLIGNRVFGDRIFAISSPEAIRAAYAVLLLLPQVPMMFMGDEFGASSPFPYFCDFHGDLAEAVRRGRCEQLSQLPDAPDAETLKRAPDPEAESTFLSGKLRWNEVEDSAHAEWLEWFRNLLKVRRGAISPVLSAMTSACGSYEVVARGALVCEWKTEAGWFLRLEANLCSTPNHGFRTLVEGSVLWVEGVVSSEGRFGQWTVRWSIQKEIV